MVQVLASVLELAGHITQRVTYCRKAAPGTELNALLMALGLRSATFMVAVSVDPSGDSARLVPPRSRLATLLPPITGYSASPALSPVELVGALVASPCRGDTGVPNRPRPPSWRSTVTTGAPAWSASPLVGVKPCCSRPLVVSSYSTSAAPVWSMVTLKKSARLRSPWEVMQPVPCRQMLL